MNLFYNKIYIIGISLMSLLFKDFKAVEIPVSVWGLAILAGFIINALLISPSTISAIDISLEKENLNFIKSLPFSFKSYLQRKLMFVTLFEWVSGILLFVIISVLIKIHWLLLLAFIIGYSFSCYIFSLHYFKRDFKLMLLDWSDVSELNSRGAGTLIQSFSIFISVLFLTFTLLFSFLWLIEQQESTQHIFGYIVLILIILVTILYHLYSKRHFWNTMDTQKER